MCVRTKFFQLCLTLCNLMDCNPPGSSNAEYIMNYYDDGYTNYTIIIIQLNKHSLRTEYVLGT